MGVIIIDYKASRERITAAVDGELEKLFQTNCYLYEHPELGHEEFLAAERLTAELAAYGFEIEKGVCGSETAFVGTKAYVPIGRSADSLPKVGFFCEYDALPEIGHACGHNLIATMSLGAAAALATALGDTGGGTIYVYGTPAEESGGLKVAMSDAGLFDELDAAIITHPNGRTEESGSSLALLPQKYRFHGKTAHAAAAPEKGINALDSVILLYNGINALRQHLTSDVKIHGIITNGGAAPNIVPDLAEAAFYIRAGSKNTLLETAERVSKIAHAAADMTGATVEIEPFEESYLDLKTNQSLSKVYNGHLRDMGESIHAPSDGVGSIDMGNVSYRAPAVHGWLGFAEPELVPHTREFAERTVTDDGKRVLRTGAIAMALTGLDILTDAELRARIRDEFELASRSI